MRDMSNIIQFFRQAEPAAPAGDGEFRALRAEIADVLEAWAVNHGNTELAEKAYHLLNRMEEIEKKDSSGHTFERAQTNTAVIASRMRRTHYAAYVAGKLSMSEDIGDKFKSWMMHNAAANGAITLGEAIDSLLVQKRAGADDESLRVLKVFRNGAFEDAVRFIALAENFDKSSVLTAYNKAKLDILSKNPEVRSMGIGRLAAITPPADDCHPAEIPWHEDNCLMFKRHDDGIRKVISVHDADKLKMIDHVLELNCKKAQAIKEARGDIWQQQPKPNRTVVATLATGLLVTGIATQNADTLEAIADFVRVSVEALSWLVPSAEAATLGDGGLAQPATMTIEAVRATFGDGGLA